MAKDKIHTKKPERLILFILIILSVALIIVSRTDYAKAFFRFKNSPLTYEQRKEILAPLPEGSKLAVNLVYLTGYTGASNTPPGSDEISRLPFHANLGDGSFADPITIAVNPEEAKYKVAYDTMVYIPTVGWAKAEDYCGKCVEEGDKRYRLDLWLGMDATEDDAKKMTGLYWVYFLRIKY